MLGISFREWKDVEADSTDSSANGFLSGLLLQLTISSIP
jgi:hypothetical protein